MPHMKAHFGWGSIDLTFDDGRYEDAGRVLNAAKQVAELPASARFEIVQVDIADRWRATEAEFDQLNKVFHDQTRVIDRLRTENRALESERDAALLKVDDLVFWVHLARCRIDENGGGETTINNVRGVLQKALDLFAHKPGDETRAWAERQARRHNDPAAQPGTCWTSPLVGKVVRDRDGFSLQIGGIEPGGPHYIRNHWGGQGAGETGPASDLFPPREDAPVTGKTVDEIEDDYPSPTVAPFTMPLSPVDVLQDRVAELERLVHSLMRDRDRECPARPEPPPVTITQAPDVLWDATFDGWARYRGRLDDVIREIRGTMEGRDRLREKGSPARNGA